MEYFVYILKSLKNQSYYVGYTSDIVKRIKQHNEGLVLSTRYKRPCIIVYKETFNSSTEARRRESVLKKKKSRKYLDWLILNQQMGV